MSETVKLVRKRPSDYTVRYNNGVKDVIYKWVGCKTGAKPFSLSIPREVFDHLNLSGATISSGALVLADEQPNKEEILQEVQGLDEALANSHTAEEIEKLLRGNINTMKKELNLITSRQEKLFVKQIKEAIAESEGLNNTKIEFIDTWFKSEDVE